MSENDDYEHRLTMLLQDAIDEAGPIRAETMRAMWRLSAVIFAATTETLDPVTLDNMGSEIGKMFVRMVNDILAEEAEGEERQ